MKAVRLAQLYRGIGVAGVLLTLAAGGAVAVAAALGARCHWLPLILLAYVAGQFLLTTARVGRAGSRRHLGCLVALTVLTILLSWWDLVVLFFGLPFIALTMILGPLATAVSFLSAVTLALYLADVVGYDLPGYATLLNRPWQAAVAAGVMAAAFAVVWWHYSREEGGDWPLARAADLAYEVRLHLQTLAAQIVEGQ
jgi:hypothetical protein